MDKTVTKKYICHLLSPVDKQFVRFDANGVDYDFNYLDENYALSGKSVIVLKEHSGFSGIPKAVLHNLEVKSRITHLLRCVNRIPLSLNRQIFIEYYLKKHTVCAIAMKLYLSNGTVYRCLKEAEREFAQLV